MLYTIVAVAWAPRGKGVWGLMLGISKGSESDVGDQSLTYIMPSSLLLISAFFFVYSCFFVKEPGWLLPESVLPALLLHSSFSSTPTTLVGSLINLS